MERATGCEARQEDTVTLEQKVFFIRYNINTILSFIRYNILASEMTFFLEEFIARQPCFHGNFVDLFLAIYLAQPFPKKRGGSRALPGS